MKCYRATTINLFPCVGESKAALALSVVFVLIAICMPVAGWGQTQWGQNIITFDPAGSVGTLPTCVNDRRMVVGQALTTGGSYNVFIRNPDGNYITFPLPGS